MNHREAIEIMIAEFRRRDMNSERRRWEIILDLLDTQPHTQRQYEHGDIQAALAIIKDRLTR